MVLDDGVAFSAKNNFVTCRNNSREFVLGADGKEVNDEFYDFDTMPTDLDYMAA